MRDIGGISLSRTRTRLDAHKRIRRLPQCRGRLLHEGNRHAVAYPVVAQSASSVAEVGIGELKNECQALRIAARGHLELKISGKSIAKSIDGIINPFRACGCRSI